MASAEFLSVLPYAAVAGVFVGLYFLRRHVRGTVCRSDARLDGKTAIVTGANTGIGRATAQELAARGGYQFTTLTLIMTLMTRKAMAQELAAKGGYQLTTLKLNPDPNPDPARPQRRSWPREILTRKDQGARAGRERWVSVNSTNPNTDHDSDPVSKVTAQVLGVRVCSTSSCPGARVILACRDMTKAELAASEIRHATGNGNVVAGKLDLASLASVREFAARINREEERLDVLVNNAGVMWCPRRETADGFELQFGVNHLGHFLLTNLYLSIDYDQYIDLSIAPSTGVMWCPRRETADGFELQFGVNHLGHFLLTNLLLDKLRSCAPSRVVTVSAVGHKSAHIDFGNLNGEKSYSPFQANFQSKLANALFSRELANRTRGTGVSAFSLDPGPVSTDIARHMRDTLGPVLYAPFWLSTGVSAFSLDPGPVSTDIARHMRETLGPVLYAPFWLSTGVSAFSLDPGPVRTDIARHMRDTPGPVLYAPFWLSTGVSVFSLDPGPVRTDIARHMRETLGPVLYAPFWLSTGVSAFSLDPGPVSTDIARHMRETLGPVPYAPFWLSTGVSAFSLDPGPVSTDIARHMRETLGPVLYAPFWLSTGVSAFSLDPGPVSTDIARHMRDTLGPVLYAPFWLSTGVSAFSLDPGPVRTDIARHMRDTLGPVLYAPFWLSTGVSAFSLDPGPVRTDIARHMRETLGPVLYAPFWLILKLIQPIVKTPRQGAQTVVHCAVAEGLEECSGMYFSECTPAEPAPQAKDDAVARRLWEVSAEMVGIKN
ncbi:RDH11 [Branchiostoma lanceolatum]|uniref:RDH11 protein n=1 Tax=Branchiostoma lanceolatum TaxID=7740 RepID=A0A8K0EA93_BRALA|nr:RDH11 [Branchiostoma lanceolatum]